MTIAALWEKDADEPLLRLEIDGEPKAIRFAGGLFLFRRPGEWHRVDDDVFEVAAPSDVKLAFKLAGHRSLSQTRMALRKFLPGKTALVSCCHLDYSDCKGVLFVNEKDEVVDCHVCGKVWKVERK